MRGLNLNMPTHISEALRTAGARPLPRGQLEPRVNEDLP